MTEPPALEHTISGVSVFERSLLKKRNLRPFHMDCHVTKRRLCYCPKSGIKQQHEQHRVESMMIASDLLNYFEGYEPDQEKRFLRKVIFLILRRVAFIVEFGAREVDEHWEG